MVRSHQEALDGPKQSQLDIRDEYTLNLMAVTDSLQLSDCEHNRRDRRKNIVVSFDELMK